MVFSLIPDRCSLSDETCQFYGRVGEAGCFGITTAFFLSKVYSHLTSASPPVYTIAIASGAVYHLIRNRSEAYRLYCVTRRHLYENYSRDYKQTVERAVQKALSDEMGKKWMQVKNFSLDTAESYLKKGIKGGTCDGEVRTFLECVHRDQNWLKEDSELEDKIRPVSFVAYQVMRDIMHEMRDYALSFHYPILESCIKYDPYFAYEDHQVYKRLVGARAFDLMISEIMPLIQNSHKDQQALLIGKIYFGGIKDAGHAIAAQFNFSRYRFRDYTIFSFPSQQALVDKLFKLSKTYLETYTATQITLWKLPVC